MYVSCATVHTLLGLRLGLSRFKNLPKGTKPVHRLAGRWVYLPMFLLIPSNKNQNQALTYNTFKEKKVSLLMTRFSHVSSSLLWSYKWDKLQKSLDTTVSHNCCSHNFLLSSLEGKCTKTKASFYKWRLSRSFKNLHEVLQVCSLRAWQDVYLEIQTVSRLLGFGCQSGDQCARSTAHSSLNSLGCYNLVLVHFNMDQTVKNLPVMQ